jgi:hypothetical protein
MLNYCDTVAHNYTPCFFIKGSAHRNIELILWCAAPSKRGYRTIATNITVRCTYISNFPCGSKLR